MRDCAQTGWLIERTSGDCYVVIALGRPEKTRAANRAETSARSRGGLVPFQAATVCQLEIAKRSRAVGREMPVRPPALAAVAIDDIAQRTVHDITDLTAKAAAAVSIAHVRSRPTDRSAQ